MNNDHVNPVTPEETEAPADEAPTTVTISRGQYINEFAGIVRDVHKRFQIPHGTAFNVVAFAFTQFDAKADAAQRSAAQAAAFAQTEEVQ